MNDWWIRRVWKPAAIIGGLAPLALLIGAAVAGNLSANPIDDITDRTGTWTLRFLMITLAITPLRKMFGWHVLIKFRRMAGLFAFFYGTLHLTTFVVLDHFFDFASIVPDIYKRPFITAGFTALVVMIPLAITSTKGWIARLGGKNWQRLHRLTYVAAIAGVLHYIWLVKLDLTRPLAYAALLSVLLGYRAYDAFKPTLAKRQSKTAVAAARNRTATL